MKSILLLIVLVTTYCGDCMAQTIVYFESIHQADSLVKLKQYTKAADFYDKALANANGKFVNNDWYNAACIYALSGNREKAFHVLDELALSPRFRDGKSLVADADLGSLHEDPRWKEIQKRMAYKDSVAQTKINKRLKAKLGAIFDLDQLYRRQMDSVYRHYGENSPQMDMLEGNMERVDSVNLIIVRSILDKYGWLGADVIGGKGSTTLWVVIQHADNHPELQRKYLPMMRKAVADGVADSDLLALLEDRVLANENKPQLYGTQLKRNEQGIYQPLTIADSSNVDIRRAAMGLGPLKYYLEESNPK
jgi:tetratricopeptide (TPR) repeat protein